MIEYHVLWVERVDDGDGYGYGQSHTNTFVTLKRAKDFAATLPHGIVPQIWQIEKTRIA